MVEGDANTADFRTTGPWKVKKLWVDHPPLTKKKEYTEYGVLTSLVLVMGVGMEKATCGRGIADAGGCSVSKSKAC